MAIGKARRLATAHGVEATFVEADARTWQPPGRYDLVALCYLQMPPDMLGSVLERLVPAVAAGGTLLSSATIGATSPRAWAARVGTQVLLDPGDVAGLVRPHLAVERAETVERPVPEADRPALEHAGPGAPNGRRPVGAARRRVPAR